MDNKIVVVAEDEEINFVFLKDILERTGAKVLHAPNGKIAVDLCAAYKVDLVLMDIKMPVMNGIEATTIIKKQYPELTVIMQTAYASSTDRRIAFEAGCSDFISKPINKAMLHRILQKHFG